MSLITVIPCYFFIRNDTIIRKTLFLVWKRLKNQSFLSNKLFIKLIIMSKLKKISYASVAGITALSVSSCGKYEDGPNMSLLSKKARVVGSWNVRSIGTEVFPSNYVVNLNFEKSGSATFTYTYAGGGGYTYAGTWDFAADKENLLLNIDGSPELFEIKRLTNKEIWLDDDISAVDGDIWKLEAK